MSHLETPEEVVFVDAPCSYALLQRGMWDPQHEWEQRKRGWEKDESTERYWEVSGSDWKENINLVLFMSQWCFLVEVTGRFGALGQDTFSLLGRFHYPLSCLGAANPLTCSRIMVSLFLFAIITATGLMSSSSGTSARTNQTTSSSFISCGLNQHILW